jgi:lantibiotic biosynthesis protein
MTEASKISGFAPSGFFVLQTPLLPFQEMMSWSEGLEAVDALDDPESLDEALDKDRRRLRERLLAVMTNPQLRDAIFVASPTLDEGFKSWQREPNSKRGRKVEAALVSYFSRAAARSTPFGLFAGCTTGTIDIRTCLQLQGRHQYQRHSRLDMDYLWALAEALQQDPRLRAALTCQRTPVSMRRRVGCVWRRHG